MSRQRLGDEDENEFLSDIPVDDSYLSENDDQLGKLLLL